MITGFLGESSQPGHQRCYLDPACNEYLDIPTDAIVHTQQLDPASALSPSGLGGSAVFVKQDAQMTISRSEPISAAQFLQGDVTQGGQISPEQGAQQRFLPALFAIAEGVDVVGSALHSGGVFKTSRKLCNPLSFPSWSC